MFLDIDRLTVCRNIGLECRLAVPGAITARDHAQIGQLRLDGRYIAINIGATTIPCGGGGFRSDPLDQNRDIIGRIIGQHGICLIIAKQKIAILGLDLCLDHISMAWINLFGVIGQDKYHRRIGHRMGDGCNFHRRRIGF